MGFISHHQKLAALLRECANCVERDEFHPDMYQVAGLLQAYAGQQSLKKSEVTTTPKTTAAVDSIHVTSSLGKGLKKGLGLEKKKTRVNPSSAQATSRKNEVRVWTEHGDLARKAENGVRSTVNNYCNVHLCLGCACKEQKTTATLKAATSTASSTTESVHSHSPVQDTPQVNLSAEVEWKESTVPPAEQTKAHKSSVEASNHRMTVSELRAIAHGAGINTAGMERQELEAAVSKIAGAAQSDTAKEKQRHEEESRRKQEMEAELRVRQAVTEEEKRRREQVEEEQQQERQQQQQQGPQNRQQHQPQQQQWQQQQSNQQHPFYGVPGAGPRRATSPPGQAPHPPQQGQAPPPQRPGQGPPPPRPGQGPHPPQPGQGAPTSPINVKYARMAAQDDEDGQAAITAIKHNILVHWALQPPLLQMLRPIDVLISTIHTVFPPVFGVAGHDYFSTWQAVKREDLIGAGNHPVEEKLKKGVRKLRFFLHPDKLPRDLSDEQKFMCKMLWDITSDAWDEFEKHKEELDWIRN